MDKRQGKPCSLSITASSLCKTPNILNRNSKSHEPEYPQSGGTAAIIPRESCNIRLHNGRNGGYWTFAEPVGFGLSDWMVHKADRF